MIKLLLSRRTYCNSFQYDKPFIMAYYLHPSATTRFFQHLIQTPTTSLYVFSNIVCYNQIGFMCRFYSHEIFPYTKCDQLPFKNYYRIPRGPLSLIVKIVKTFNPSFNSEKGPTTGLFTFLGFSIIS